MAKKKQLEIKGAERKTDEKLDELVERLVSTRAERLRLLGEVRTAQSDLASELARKKLKQYAYIDGEAKYVVTVKPGHDGLGLKVEKLKEQEVQA